MELLQQIYYVQYFSIIFLCSILLLWIVDLLIKSNPYYHEALNLLAVPAHVERSGQEIRNPIKLPRSPE